MPHADADEASDGSDDEREREKRGEKERKREREKERKREKVEAGLSFFLALWLIVQFIACSIKNR